MSRLTELPKEASQQCKMPSDFVYPGPTEVDVPYMKEGQQDGQMQAVCDQEVLQKDTESKSPNLFPNNESYTFTGRHDSNVSDGTFIF